MYTPTLLHVLAFMAFTRSCLPLPVSQSPNVESEMVSPRPSSAGQSELQTDATSQGRQASTISNWPKEKRASQATDQEDNLPLTNAMLKIIRDAMPVLEEGLQKRQNSNSTSASGILGINSLSPDTQSMLKDTIRYGIALVMKTGSWALSP